MKNLVKLLKKLCENYDNKFFIGIQIVLEVNMYSQRLLKKIFGLYGPLSCTGLTCFEATYDYWFADCFHYYLNRMPQALNHRSYILRIEKG